MAKSQGIRHRLLSILLLGVIVSALSLAALIHLLSTTTRQRVERAREATSEEVDGLARDATKIAEPAPLAIVGMRGGVWRGQPWPVSVPRDWQPSIERAAHTADETSGRATLDVPLGDATLVVAARPSDPGTFVWAGFLVRPLPSLRTWQWIVTLLALATAGLVATTVYSVVTVQKGASELRQALQALATDLSAPIPRPNVRELSSVADGIARLADGLAQARREEGRLQRELAQQERLAALGRVAAGVAHEVRNPLASIKLRLDLAAATTSLPSEVEKAISHATTEIGRLDRLVADLLVVAGRAAGPRKSAALGALVRSRVDALSPWASERGVLVSTEGDAQVEADVDSVARAIDNLLRNAVEASPAGGRVDVLVEARDSQAVVSVRDGGAGVPAEHGPELFEPFFTTKPDGTGLGLALSRAIARAHGGDVAYAREGAVTRFDSVLAGSSSDGDGTPALRDSETARPARNGLFA